MFVDIDSVLTEGDCSHVGEELNFGQRGTVFCVFVPQISEGRLWKVALCEEVYDSSIRQVSVLAHLTP